MGLDAERIALVEDMYTICMHNFNRQPVTVGTA